MQILSPPFPRPHSPATRLIRFFPCALVALTALTSATAAPALAADSPVAIKFDRPAKAGQAFAFSAAQTTRTHQTITQPDGTPSNSEVFNRIALDADIHIDTIDDKAHPAQLTLIIKSLTLETKIGTDPLLKPGTKVTLTFPSNQPAFTQNNGEKIPDDAAAALRPLFQSQREQTLSYDAIYGTTDRKKTGDSWPISTRSLVTDLQLPAAIDPSQITGTSTLKSVKPIDGTPCAQLESVLHIQNVPVQGAKARESTVTINVSSTQPVDPAKPIRASSVRTLTHIVVDQQPNGRAIFVYTIDSETSQVAAWTPKP